MSTGLTNNAWCVFKGPWKLIRAGYWRLPGYVTETKAGHQQKISQNNKEIVQQHQPSLAMRNFLSKLMIAQLYEAALERMFKR